jgi:hypothetical protein
MGEAKIRQRALAQLEDFVRLAMPLLSQDCQSFIESGVYWRDEEPIPGTLDEDMLEEAMARLQLLRQGVALCGVEMLHHDAEPWFVALVKAERAL